MAGQHAAFVNDAKSRLAPDSLQGRHCVGRRVERDVAFTFLYAHLSHEIVRCRASNLTCSERRVGTQPQPMLFAVGCEQVDGCRDDF
jgi:hypothetical protein